jgi:co-chaperonin GroES (HSP10)
MKQEGIKTKPVSLYKGGPNDIQYIDFTELPLQPLADRVIIELIFIDRINKIILTPSEVSAEMRGEHAQLRLDPNAKKISEANITDFYDHPKQGVVRAIGSGFVNSEGNLIPMEVKVGDIVYYDPRQFIEQIVFEGMVYGVIRQSGIVCIDKTQKFN